MELAGCAAGEFHADGRGRRRGRREERLLRSLGSSRAETAEGRRKAEGRAAAQLESFTQMDAEGGEGAEGKGCCAA